MKTLLDILNLSETYLKERGVDRPRREAEELLADVLGLKRLDLFLQFERPLNDEELFQARSVLKRRGEGEPLAHISGKVAFAGVEIVVTPAVLTPRPETEILVEQIAKVFADRVCEGKVLWDVGCGSGCIGIALKSRFPELKVICSDISEEALQVARKNAEVNLVEVEFRHGDLFAPFGGEMCTFLVSNPPYIAEGEYAGLMREVREFEPKCALVGGETGLEMYERLAAGIDAHVARPGHVWLEIGTGQGAAIKSIFEGGVVEPDWAGHDRFFSLEKD